MPSPFPGMDPFLENQEWEDFHTRFNTVISETLAPSLQPRYIVRVERRVYVERALEEVDHAKWSDVAVLRPDKPASGTLSPASTATGTAIAPVDCLLPMPQERRETFLVIRERETMEVITVLEVLSPSNKRPGSDGRKQYLEKREAVLQSHSHLIELDLLRGGHRLPVLSPLPAGDHYAIVSRRLRRPRAEVYAWTIRQSLPSIPTPLKEKDPDVPLDLQQVFTTVYDRARYDLSLNYRGRLDPPLDDADATWCRHLIDSRKAPAS